MHFFFLSFFFFFVVVVVFSWSFDKKAERKGIHNVTFEMTKIFVLFFHTVVGKKCGFCDSHNSCERFLMNFI